MKDLGITSRLAKRAKEFIEEDTVVDFDSKDEFKRWLWGIAANDDESMEIMIAFAKKSVDQVEFFNLIGVDRHWEKRKALLSR